MASEDHGNLLERIAAMSNEELAGMVESLARENAENAKNAEGLKQRAATIKTEITEATRAMKATHIITQAVEAELRRRRS